MKADMSYWRFVEEWHPMYCSDDRVLLCDILFRYLEKEDVDEDDKEWIAREFNSSEEIVRELKQLEKDLFSESLDIYYEQLFASNGFMRGSNDNPVAVKITNNAIKVE